MKRAVLAVSFSLLVFAGPAFGEESVQPQKAPEASFEQRKADILKNIDQRIGRLQEEKACVQATKSPDDLKACREKFKPDMKHEGHMGQGAPGGHGERKPGRPGDQGGPGPQGGPSQQGK